ncbi:quinone oxidoreductase-like protein 2 homolog [Toxorhynchites rutilus septentrionalis]|uniref:quinone oxidoreductase-like protein 2 homolog n=1 Tax=Toxorhynchites rutilus septentrionalis TaxID=329112 RepID=UPI00247AEE56|nr:quinone oxidoreductase-like protein 2 homolog [Toxorhynchites rutilus septentrionalis]
MLGAVINSVLRSSGVKFKQNVTVVLRQSHKAAILREIGKPLVLENVKRIEKLKEDEVRIKVHYCSLNSTDVQIISGKHPDLQVSLPFIPGHEVSGEVMEIGKNNPNFLKRGDRVVAMNDLQDPNGGLTAEMIVKNRDVWSVPSDIPLREMTVLPYGHGTALLTFAVHCPLQENDLVLITAGPAGMGLAAVDVAVNVYKAKVIAICDTESSSDLVREKGAYKTVSMGKNYTKLYKSIADAMGDKKAKVAYDAVGKQLLHLLADFVDHENGQLISVDPFNTPEKLKAYKPEYELPKKMKRTEEDKTNSAKLLSNVKHVDLYEHPDEDVYRQMISDTIEMREEGMIAGYISKVFRLKEIQEAVQFIQQKQCTGKVLIDVKCSEEDDCEDEFKEQKKKDD